MRRLLWTACLFLACDASSSQPPEPKEADAAPALVRAEPPAVAEHPPPTLDTPDPDPEPERPPLSIVSIAPDAGPLRHQLKLHARRGAENGQRVVLEMGAPWCPPCKRAKALLEEDAVKTQLGGIVMLRVNSDAWGEDLDTLGFDAPVIPVYYVLDDEGAPTKKSVRGDRWKNQAQVRAGLLAFLTH